MFSAGDYVPVMPLLDVVGSAVKVPTLQIGATASNVGVTVCVMVISMVTVAVAHWPAVGVNV